MRFRRASALTLILLLAASICTAQMPVITLSGLTGLSRLRETKSFVALARTASLRPNIGPNNFRAINSGGGITLAGGLIKTTTGSGAPSLENVAVSNSYEPQFGCPRLCLPYFQSLNAGDTGFAIVNEGAGDAIHAEAKGGDIGSAVVAINSMGSSAKLAFRGLGAEIKSSVTTAIAAQGATIGIDSRGGTIGVHGLHSSSGNFGQLGTGSQGVFGSSSGGVGVQGQHGGTGNFGQLGTSIEGVFGSSNGIGVRGFSSGGNGVRGESPSGFGVRGDSTSGFGVVGFSSNSDAVMGFGKNGVHGQSSSASDSGVWGENIGGGYGVSGSTTSTATSGVWGQNLGYGPGVKGTSSSGVGVYGSSSSSVGISGTSTNYSGVIGRNAAYNNQGDLGSNSSGVSGYHGATANSGQLGTAFSGVSAYHGATGNTGYLGLSYAAVAGYGAAAGYFYGNAQVTGNLSKGGGSFKIDHPLDPENKYLYHSFVESPDMKNIYDGTVKLDENGEAEVNLPEWFEALNSDFRYLLTPIGAPAPGLYIADEVNKNRFRIAGGVAGMKVSWQVTGIRQDAYAKKNRILVEEEKSEAERGFYLHPEAHGQSEEKNIEWARNPEIMKQMKKERAGQPQQK